MKAPLPYLLITVKDIGLIKISASYIQNLRTVFNTMTADNKHSLLICDNLTQPIQMKLSKKLKPFSQFF